MVTPPTAAADDRATQLVADAYRIADEVLFPAAGEVDRTGVIPQSHWDALASASLFGIAAPAEIGGPALDFAQVLEIQEVLASGCLSTAFTWLQHHGVVISLASTSNAALREELLQATISGTQRAGVAYAGVVPATPRMTATRTADGWLIDGYAPFVSGWGIVDLLQISARDTDTDDVISAIIPADPTTPEIASTSMNLSAGNATRTAFLRVTNLAVPDARVVSRTSYPDFLANQNIGVRINGTLPFGIVRRATALLEQSAADDGLEVAAARSLRERAGTIRTRLDTSIADTPALLAARADAAQLGLDAAAALVSAHGGRSLLSGNNAERLARESMFTLVAASRPAVKDLLMEHFSAAPPRG